MEKEGGRIFQAEGKHLQSPRNKKEHDMFWKQCLVQITEAYVVRGCGRRRFVPGSLGLEFFLCAFESYRNYISAVLRLIFIIYDMPFRLLLWDIFMVGRY